jgi:hypothetical protein
MTLQSPLPGLTLTEYAAAKRLSADFLRAIGLSDATYGGQRAVRISFFGATGELLAVRFQIALDGDCFRWKSGSAKRPPLYGLSRIADARKFGVVVLAGDELSCQILWSHGVPALGVLDWVEERDAQHLSGIEKIYVVESDDSDVKQKWLARSIIRYRVDLIKLDPFAVHREDPERFKARWQVVCLAATPWQAIEAKLTAEARFEAWQRCEMLAQKPDILDDFETNLTGVGLVGERRAAKLLYLAVTSRLLDRPVSIVVKGPSSGGKSFAVETVLRFFPPEAFYVLTGMSERTLVYSPESFAHRILVLYEAAGLNSGFVIYCVRSLLSENRLRYETVVSGTTRLIEREGPTGLISTTTSLHLDPETETRMLSLTVNDTRDQTAAVLKQLAQDRGDGGDRDLGQWHALQTWLATGPIGVVIPFASQLAELVPPVAIRLRRDFKLVLMMVRAHALLHQASRRKDEAGRIVATIKDYQVVRDLVADLMAEGVDAQVKPETREVVALVRKLLASREEVRQVDLLPHLKLDKSAISRRIGAALDAGFLRNRERDRFRPARLVLGDALPKEIELLPSPNRLRSCAGREEGSSEPRGDEAV